MHETFDPPVLLNSDALPEFPRSITTRREATTVVQRLPTCGIRWCGVVACFESSTDMTKLRLALATALDRYGFLSDDDVDARRSTAFKENSMVSRWPSMRDMQSIRKAREESNREKLKPKKDKSKDAPTAGTSYKEQFGKPKKK